MAVVWGERTGCEDEMGKENETAEGLLKDERETVKE